MVKKEDFNNFMHLTDFIKIKSLDVGAVLLTEEIIKAQSAYIKNQKTEISKYVKELIKISEQTINAVTEISLISFYLYSYRKENKTVNLNNKPRLSQPGYLINA